MRCLLKNKLDGKYLCEGIGAKFDARYPEYGLREVRMDIKVNN